jgi:hypothetical protein
LFCKYFTTSQFNSNRHLQQEDKILFELLKKEIAAAMKSIYPGMNPEISEWKGQEIIDFQEDLLNKVNGRLSEKWFYTHFKASNKSLPRIDVLNILSLYAGYTNWDDFKYKHTELSVFKQTADTSNKVFINIPIIVISVMLVLFIIYRLSTRKTIASPSLMQIPANQS